MTDDHRAALAHLGGAMQQIGLIDGLATFFETAPQVNLSVRSSFQFSIVFLDPHQIDGVDQLTCLTVLLPLHAYPCVEKACAIVLILDALCSLETQ